MSRASHLLPMALVSLLALGACDSDPTQIIQDFCSLEPLPLSGNADAPVVTDVALEVQPGQVVFLMTATDPQGDQDLVGIQQTVGVFPDIRCQGDPVQLVDDLACSGCEESFGNVATDTGNPTLFNAISAAATWPVAVDIVDADGNRTVGRVSAQVVR